jgi:Fe-S cluster biogenesis protein NfuA
MHPEAGARTQELRWIIPPHTLSFSGSLLDAPGLGALLRDGTLTAVHVSPGTITTISGGAKWEQIGATVRTALAHALLSTDRWRLQADSGEDLEQRVRAAVAEVIAGEFGDYVRSHGGEIVVSRIDGDTVYAEMSGTCRSCMAAEISLRAGFERRLREQCPQARVA